MKNKEKKQDTLANPRYPEIAEDVRLRREKVITISKEQLLYEIEAKASLVARSRRNEFGEDANVDRWEQYRPLFTRWIVTYTNKAMDRMRAYLVVPDYDHGMDSAVDWQEKPIRLRFPDYWDGRGFGALVDAVHNYIVSSCLYELFSLCLGGNDVLCVGEAQKAQNADKDIKYLVSAVKAGTVHKPYAPFPR